jgi:hypothetical protein
MTKTIETPRKLSNMQAMLLQMFEADLSENDLLEVKNLLSRFLFKKAEQEAEKAMKAKDITLKQLNKEMDNMTQGNRSNYLRKIRSQKHESSH